MRGAGEAHRQRTAARATRGGLRVKATAFATGVVTLLVTVAALFVSPATAGQGTTVAGLSGGALAASASTSLALAFATNPDSARVASPPTLLAALAPPAERVVEGQIARGDTLAKSLARQGLSKGAISQIQREMADKYDFRRAKAGHRYRITMSAEGCSSLLPLHRLEDGALLAGERRQGLERMARRIRRAPRAEEDRRHRDDEPARRDRRSRRRRELPPRQRVRRDLRLGSRLLPRHPAGRPVPYPLRAHLCSPGQGA